MFHVLQQNRCAELSPIYADGFNRGLQEQEVADESRLFMDEFQVIL